MAMCRSVLIQSCRSVRGLQHHRSIYSQSQSAGEIPEKLRGFPGGSVDLKKLESGLALMTVNNPTRMNAFTGSMMIELEERVHELETWSEGKGLIVQGAAGTFCSGSDLNAVRAMANPQAGRPEHERLNVPLNDLLPCHIDADGMKMCEFMQNTLTRLLRLPLISVALVEGKALGGGAELATACDFRLMTYDSVIQFVHKHMGLVPGWGGAARLVRIIGSQNSMKLLAGAIKVDPDFGKQIGLVDEVLHCSSGEENTLTHAEQWLSHFIKGPASVIQAAKRVVVSGRELPLEEALGAERNVFGTVWGGPANLEALASKTKHK